MGVMRTKWQEFKKKYPDFERHKQFKADVGPQADAFETSVAECLKLAKALLQKMNERDVKGTALKDSFKRYTGVMLELKKVDPKKFGHIQADCSLQLDGNRAGDELYRAVQEIKKKEHFNFTL